MNEYNSSLEDFNNSLEELLTILERVAKGFPDESEESKAIEVAAKAIVFLEAEASKEKFQSWVKREELSDEEIERMYKLGIYPTSPYDTDDKT